MAKEKKGVKAFKKNQAKKEKALKAGAPSSKAKSKAEKASSSVKKSKKPAVIKKIPKHERMEEEDVGQDRVLKIKRPKRDQDANIEKYGGTMKKHKKDLQDLEEQDPEFFEFMKENDSDLLAFGEDSEEEGSEEEGESIDSHDEEEGDLAAMDEDESDDEDEEDANVRIKPRPAAIEVTAGLLKGINEGAKKGSASKLRKLVSMFRAACVPSSGEMDLDDDGEEDAPTSRFTISSPKIYQQVMETVLDNLHIALYAQLGQDVESSFPPSKDALEALGKTHEWKRVQLSVLSFFKSYMHVLRGVIKASIAKGEAHSEAVGGGGENEGERVPRKQNKRTGRKEDRQAAAAADEGESPMEVTVFLLRSIEPYIPLLTPMPRLCKNFMKLLLELWSQGPLPGADQFNLRAHAFLRFRQIAITLPGAFTEEAFRSIYLTYARCAKTFSEMTASSVLFMMTCIAELYSCDLVQAYQQGFLYIRQLALHLRTAVMKKTSENVRQVTSWQYLNCLRLWTRVVSSQPAEDELGALSFPLSQVLFGVMSLAESMYLTPLKFHLTSCAQLLAAHCRTFLPTAAKMVDILESQDITSKSVASTDAPPLLNYCVKLPTDSLSRAPVRDLVVQEAITLLRHDAEIYRYHVGFPEYAMLTIRKLRIFAKGSKVARWRDLARTAAGQLEAFSADAKKGRARLGRSPAEITDFEPLLPASAGAAAARLTKLCGGQQRGVHAMSSVPSAPAGTGAGGRLGEKKAAVEEEESDDEDSSDGDNSDGDNSDGDNSDGDDDSGGRDRIKKFDMDDF